MEKKMKYNIKEITPKDMQCIAAACPAIYEEITPKSRGCILTACPQIYEGNDNYFIVGKIVDPKEVGLEKKVGGEEALIEVPKGLIDGIVK